MKGILVSLFVEMKITSDEFMCFVCDGRETETLLSRYTQFHTANINVCLNAVWIHFDFISCWIGLSICLGLVYLFMDTPLLLLCDVWFSINLFYFRFSLQLLAICVGVLRVCAVVMVKPAANVC